MNRGRREEDETERRHLLIAKGKMDKGGVPRDDYILHGCLSVAMETVCVYMSRIGELSCVQGVCVDAEWEPPPTVSASIPSKLTVIKTNCDHISCRGCELVLVCVISRVQVRT